MLCEQGTIQGLASEARGSIDSYEEVLSEKTFYRTSLEDSIANTNTGNAATVANNITEDAAKNAEKDKVPPVSTRKPHLPPITPRPVKVDEETGKHLTPVESPETSSKNV